MNNLLSYCELIDAKIRASDKDLPVLRIDLKIAGFTKFFMLDLSWKSEFKVENSNFKDSDDTIQNKEFHNDAVNNNLDLMSLFMK